MKKMKLSVLLALAIFTMQGLGAISLHVNSDGENVVAPATEVNVDGTSVYPDGQGPLITWWSNWTKNTPTEVCYNFKTDKGHVYDLGCQGTDKMICNVNKLLAPGVTQSVTVRCNNLPSNRDGVGSSSSGQYQVKGQQLPIPIGIQTLGNFNITLKFPPLDGFKPEWYQPTVYDSSVQKSITQVQNLTLEQNDKSYNNEYTLPDNKKIITYLGEWSVYGRGFRFSNIDPKNFTAITHAFLGMCSTEALAEVNAGLANGTLGNEFKAAKKVYGTVCSGKPDGTIVIPDTWASLQKDLGHGRSDLAPSSINIGNVRGLFKEYIEAKKTNDKLKVLVSVGGWTLSHSFKHLDDLNKRKVFLDNIEAFVTKWTFIDGVDLDWEKPQNATEGLLYVDLLKDMRAALDRAGTANGKTYMLSSAVFTPKADIDKVNYTEAMKHLDYLFAMTYDYHGAWDTEIGFQTNINSAGVNGENSVETAIQNFISAGVPKNKLFLGIASYGRSVNIGAVSDISNIAPLTGTNTIDASIRAGIGSHELSVMEWYDFYNKYWIGNPKLASTEETITIGGNSILAKKVNGFFHFTDPIRDADFFVNPTTKAFFDMETPRTAYVKSKRAVDLGIAGAFYWVLEYDNGLITNAIHEGLGSTLITSNINMTDQIAIKGAIGTINPDSKQDVIKIQVIDGVDVTTQVIANALRIAKKATIRLAAGEWARYVNFPISGVDEGSIVEITRDTRWAPFLKVGGFKVQIYEGTTTFTFTNGKWKSSASSKGVISVPATSNNDITAQTMTDALKLAKQADIVLNNAVLVDNVYFPTTGLIEGNIVKINRFRGRNTNLHIGMLTIPIEEATTTFTFTGDKWTSPSLGKKDVIEIIIPLTTNQQEDVTAQQITNALKYAVKAKIVTSSDRWAYSINIPLTADEGSVVEIVRTGWGTVLLIGSFKSFIDMGTTTITFTDGKWVGSLDSIKMVVNDKQDITVQQTTMGLALAKKAIIHTRRKINGHGRWAPNIYIPTSAKEGSIVEVNRESASETKVHIGTFNISVGAGITTFTFTGGKWTSPAIIPVPKQAVKVIPVTNGHDVTAQAVSDTLKLARKGTINLRNGGWARHIHLPTSGIDDSNGSVIEITRSASWGTTLHIGTFTTSISHGKTTFTLENDKWKSSGAASVPVRNGHDVTAQTVNNTLTFTRKATINLRNGGWARHIHLPTSGVDDGSIVEVTRSASWGTTLHIGTFATNISHGKTTFTFTNGTWKSSGTASVPVRNGHDVTAQAVIDTLKLAKKATINLRNGGWARHIHLPTSGVDDGSIVEVTRSASWGTTLHIGTFTTSISHGKTTFTFTNGKWN